MKNVDILIIGAGPAGCSASFFSKFYDEDNENKVLLLDKLSKEKFSKYHDMCGCCISQDAFEDIRPIKPKYIIEEVSQIKEYIVNKLILKTNIKGFIIDRPKFQNHLIDKFKKLGGKYKEERLIDVIQKNDVIKVKTNLNTYKSKYLIAADGANSLIRKKLNFGDVQKVLYQQFIVDNNPEHKSLKFFYDKKYNGDYKYIFPNGNTSRIGFPFNSEKIESKNKIIKKQSRFIGYGGIKRLVNRNIIIIGDAAGQTNILSKGGIRTGMYAGKIASKAIVKHKNPRYYENIWKKAIFNEEITLEAFEKLKNMSNEELFDFYEPLKGNALSSIFKILFSKKFRQYKDIYKAYQICDKYGW